MPAGDDDRHTDEREHDAAQSRGRQRVTPHGAANNAVRTGVAAMSSAESPAGIVVSPVVHRIW